MLTSQQIKEARSRYPILGLLRKRWSPRAFSDEPVEEEKLRILFEAARWSPSALNEQPWFFIAGLNGDQTHQAIHGLLTATNRLWAGKAPVLVMACGSSRLKKDGAPNETFAYDLGQCVAHFSVQATGLDLYVHQMRGFDHALASKVFDLPGEVVALTVMAIGYLGDPAILHPRMQKAELTPRERKEADDFVFSLRFGHRTDLFQGEKSAKYEE